MRLRAVLRCARRPTTHPTPALARHGARRPLHNHAPRFHPGTPLTPRTALVAKKTTRLEMEQGKLGKGVSDEELADHLMLRGVDARKLRVAHVAHNHAVDCVVAALEARKIEAKVVDADHLTPAAAQATDLLIAAGGDGTVLRVLGALQAGVRPPPFLALNTNPALSEGALCAVRLWSGLDTVARPSDSHHPHQGHAPEGGGERGRRFLCSEGLNVVLPRDPRQSLFGGVLDALAVGDFATIGRQRARVSLEDTHGTVTCVDQLVLNEVFFAEADASMPSVFALSTNTHPSELVRSSGVVVCTGSGCSAWFHSAARIHTDMVGRVLAAVAVEASPDRVELITAEINSKLLFACDEPQLAFVVREPIVNRAMQCPHRFDRASTVRLRAMGWNSRLSLDGILQLPLRFGTKAVVEPFTGLGGLVHCVDFRHLPVHSALCSE